MSVPAPELREPAPELRGLAIELREVAKRFGRARALDRVSLSIAAGEVVGLVGPNGAGKSTALRIMAGFLDADAGTVRVAGHDLARASLAARAHIGYMPETVPLYDDMRVDEYLWFRARLKGVPRRERAGRVAAVRETCGLQDQGRRIIARLSKGYRQRVGLADALVGDPAVLLLDEPTAGLDPVQNRAFRALLRRLAGARTVLVSSHALVDIEAVADRVLVLARGRVVAEGTVDGLRAGLGMDRTRSLEDVLYALVTGDAAGVAPAGEGMGAGMGEDAGGGVSGDGDANGAARPEGNARAGEGP